MNQETTAAAMTAQIVEMKRTSNNRFEANQGRSRDRLPSEFFEELIGSNPENRNWKGIAISVFVILTVIGLVILSVIVLTPENTAAVSPKISAMDVASEKWKLGLSHVTWQGSSMIYQDSDGNLVEMISIEQDPKILIKRQVMKDNGILDYKVSKDGIYSLLMFDRTSIYKYSHNASYYIYNIVTRTKEPFIHEKSENVFQSVDFGPKGSQMVYSLAGDLYYKASAEAKSATSLTSDGIPGQYQNGIADWLYEEEILKSSSAYWWSPNGRYLAFASFDDRHVDEDFFTTYNDENADDVIPYQRTVKYRYPKAGRPNPAVNIHVVNLETFVQVTIRPPWLNGKELEIFQSLTWLNDDELLVTWSDRAMETSVLQQCTPVSANCNRNILSRSVGSETKAPNKKQGWLPNLTQKPLLSDDAGIFFYILPSDHGGMGEFDHLAFVDKAAAPSTKRFLTSGNWEVTKLLHYDSTTRDLYYISNEAHPGSRHVYKINLADCCTRTCITCKLSLQPIRNASATLHREGINNVIGAVNCDAETNCRYYDASFGYGSDWFAVTCLGPCIPFTGVVTLPTVGFTKPTETGKSIDDFAVNVINFLPQSLLNVIVPLVRFESIKNGGEEIKIKALIPASVHAGKRPVVFFKKDVGSQTVDFRFQVDLASYIVTTIGAVAVFVDGRGSGSNGNNLLQQVAGRPGTLEIEDMKAVLEHLKTKENIDTENVGIVGTSGYGGYTAALALTDSHFRCGVARSPITDWKLYESLRAEKLLGSPSHNPLLYQKPNLIHQVKGLRGSQLRIYQGMQDIKVSMQHSVLLEQAAMMSNLPPEAVQVTYHPSSDLMQNDNEEEKVEARIYESISYFLRNCLFGNSEQGRLQLDLLDTISLMMINNEYH